MAFLFLVWSLILLFEASILGAAHHQSEEKYKAVFLLKFADYVEWPAAQGTSGSSSIRVGIIGEDPFPGILPESIPPTPFGNPGFTITRLPDDAPDIADFRILYFSEPVTRTTAHLLAKIQMKPILTVGEGESFLEHGGIIAFLRENYKLKFLINLKNAQKAHLKISSNLLGLAKRLIK